MSDPPSHARPPQNRDPGAAPAFEIVVQVGPDRMNILFPGHLPLPLVVGLLDLAKDEVKRMAREPSQIVAPKFRV